jgi:hypothetical protein
VHYSIDRSASNASGAVATPVYYYPPLLLDFTSTLGCHRIVLAPHRSYAQGDYLLLYKVFHHSDKSCVLNEKSVDSAVNTPTAIAREATNSAIPYIKFKNSLLPYWFSNCLIYYIKKKINTHEGTRNRNLITTIVFFSLIANWLNHHLKRQASLVKIC